MKRIGQITYEFSEEEHKELTTNIEEIDSFFKGYSNKERAEEAVKNLERIVSGDDDE